VFTGIIEEVGRVERVDAAGGGARLRIRCVKVLDDATLGASIAVNGVCLTALDVGGGGFSADLAPETLSRTNLGDLRPGSAVNLERPLRPHDRLSGHIVQGHVDGTAALESLAPLGNGNWWLRARVPAAIDRHLVFKGSVAVDGISLTVAAIEDLVLAVTIIPHTAAHTNLSERRLGDRLNIECDILAKHIEKLLGRMEMPGRLTEAKLREEGF
jgi:riboflavin synthase